MNPTISNDILTDLQQKLACGAISNDQARAIEIASAYTLFDAMDSSLIAPAASGANIETTLSLKTLYDKIICGGVLTENEYAWALAEIARLRKVYFESTDARLAAFIEDSTHYVFAGGVYSWNGGSATTGSKTITGLLSTDIVVATLAARASTETLVLAVAAAGQINFTLSANGTNTTTKINYVVYRAKPAS